MLAALDVVGEHAQLAAGAGRPRRSAWRAPARSPRRRPLRAQRPRRRARRRRRRGSTPAWPRGVSAQIGAAAATAAVSCESSVMLVSGCVLVMTVRTMCHVTRAALYGAEASRWPRGASASAPTPAQSRRVWSRWAVNRRWGLGGDRRRAGLRGSAGARRPKTSARRARPATSRPTMRVWSRRPAMISTSRWLPDSSRRLRWNSRSGDQEGGARRACAPRSRVDAAAPRVGRGRHPWRARRRARARAARAIMRSWHTSSRSRWSTVVTRKPRLGSTSTRPELASSSIASRTGVGDTPGARRGWQRSGSSRG